MELVERKYEPLSRADLLLRSLSRQTPQKVGDQARREVAVSRSSVPSMRSRYEAPPPTMAESIWLNCASTSRLSVKMPL